MKTDILNFNRLGLMFRRYFAERSRFELIQWITMIIVFMFLRNNVTGISISIVVSGVIYASSFYKEIHSPGSGVAYFMIPASQLEKTILGVVITSFYYFVMILVAYIVGNLLGTLFFNMLASLNGAIGLDLFHHSSLQWSLFSVSFAEPGWVNVNVNGSSNFFENATTNYLLRIFHLFLIGQSIYMLGSIYFKHIRFFATFLATIVIGLILLIVFATEARLLFGNFNAIPNYSLNYDFSHTVGSILKNALWLLPPFLWVVSYFRLTEKQV